MRGLPSQCLLHSKGDVFDRMRVRMEEAGDSIRIALEALGRLSADPVNTMLPPIPGESCALGFVEGWRGEILHWVQRQSGPVQDQRSFIEQLASTARSRPGQHYSRFSGHQQKLPSLLLRNRPMSELQDLPFEIDLASEPCVRNASSEELISLPGTSPRLDDSQALCLPALGRESAENPLLVSCRVPTAGTAPGAEESSQRSAFQNPCLVPQFYSRF
jgi:hypothetical protein